MIWSPPVVTKINGDEERVELPEDAAQLSNGSTRRGEREADDRVDQARRRCTAATIAEREREREPDDRLLHDQQRHPRRVGRDVLALRGERRQREGQRGRP